MKLKKGAKIFLFIIILTIIITIGTLIIIENLIKNNKYYKGELATSKPQNLSIFVLPAIPIISIISPENITYSTTNLLLNYSIINEADFIWYNLDNGINITINSPVYFNTAEGFHVLYLYANNSEGTSVQSITFSVKIEIIQPPSGGSESGGSSGGGGGITGNKTQQQKENLTTAGETSPNVTEQETPKNMTEKPEAEPKTTKRIILILLITLVIILIAIIKRNRKKIRQKKK